MDIVILQENVSVEMAGLEETAMNAFLIQDVKEHVSTTFPGLVLILIQFLLETLMNGVHGVDGQPVVELVEMEHKSEPEHALIIMVLVEIVEEVPLNLDDAALVTAKSMDTGLNGRDGLLVVPHVELEAKHALDHVPILFLDMEENLALDLIVRISNVLLNIVQLMVNGPVGNHGDNVVPLAEMDTGIEPENVTHLLQPMEDCLVLEIL